MQLPRPTRGACASKAGPHELSGEELRKIRTRMKMIFQDPISSLNPRRKVEDIIAEGLQIWKIGTKEEQQKKVDEVMLDVGLDPELQRGKRPHQFSGGQCQRISIARAVVTDPKLIICDEPVSALDVSVQAQILNLLEDMKQRYGLTLIFIAHDLAVVKNVSDRVVVMYLGKICEVGDPDALYKQPAHPYTAALLAAIPVPDPNQRPEDRPAPRRRDPVAGRAAERLPVPHPLPEGAGAAARPRSREIREIAPGQYVACHFPLDGRRDAARRERPGADRRAVIARRGSLPRRQSEDALGDDVLVHLRRAARDRERAAVDAVARPRSRRARRGRAPPHAVSAMCCSASLHSSLAMLPSGPIGRPLQLGRDRAVGDELQQLAFEVDARELVAQHRVVGRDAAVAERRRPRVVDEALDLLPGAEVQLGDRAALVRERRHRDAPAVVDRRRAC